MTVFLSFLLFFCPYRRIFPSTLFIYCYTTGHFTYDCIVGSVVECSPATRAARVRFPDDATF